MFTYDLGTYTGKLRFYLGDNTESQGVLPGGANLTDEEIALAYEIQSSDIGSTLVRLAKIIASKWATAPRSFYADGLRMNRGDPVDKWLKLANEYAKEFNVTSKAGGYGTIKTISLLREDIDEDSF
jgi:hypothetical protein